MIKYLSITALIVFINFIRGLIFEIYFIHQLTSFVDYFDVIGDLFSHIS